MADPVRNSWGDIYLRHKRKGMDHADAAYRADEWERNQRRNGMGDELVRIETVDGFLTIPASFGGNRLKMMLIEARSFAEFVYNSSREKGDGMCEAAFAALTKIPKQDGTTPARPRHMSARPTTSNADEWQVWLFENAIISNGSIQNPEFLCVQIVEAIEEHQKVLPLLSALKEMVGRWEPDTSGQDRVMWENACAAIEAAQGRPSTDSDVVPLRLHAEGMLTLCGDLLHGMVGLVDLLLNRDDLPPAVREVLRNNHRVVAARAALGLAAR